MSGKVYVHLLFCTTPLSIVTITMISTDDDEDDPSFYLASPFKLLRCGITITIAVIRKRPL